MLSFGPDPYFRSGTTLVIGTRLKKMLSAGIPALILCRFQLTGLAPDFPKTGSWLFMNSGDLCYSSNGKGTVFAPATMWYPVRAFPMFWSRIFMVFAA